MLLDLRHLQYTVRLQAARQQIATSGVRSELDGGEDSVSGVTSARAHLV